METSLLLAVFFLIIIMSIAQTICYITVIVQMFMEQDIIGGVIAIVCSPWGFIWGWLRWESDMKMPVMTLWTICFLFSILITFSISGSGLAAP